MPSVTSYTICDICGERHPRGAAHIWKTETKSDAPVPVPIPAKAVTGNGSVNSPRRRTKRAASLSTSPAAVVRSEKKDAGAGESPAPVHAHIPRYDPNCASCQAARIGELERVRKHRERRAKEKTDG